MKRNNKKTGDIPAVVTGKELAKYTGLTRRQIEYLTRLEVLKNLETVNGKPSRYAFSESVQAYCAYLEEKKADKTEKSLELEKLAADVQYKQAKAAKARQELRELDGQYLRASDVQAFTADLLRFIRSELVSMPGRVAKQIQPGRDDAQACTAILEKEAEKILNAVSVHQYNPEDYAREVRDYEEPENENSETL